MDRVIVVVNAHLKMLGIGFIKDRDVSVLSRDSVKFSLESVHVANRL